MNETLVQGKTTVKAYASAFDLRIKKGMNVDQRSDSWFSTDSSSERTYADSRSKCGILRTLYIPEHIVHDAPNPLSSTHTHIHRQKIFLHPSTSVHHASNLYATVLTSRGQTVQHGGKVYMKSSSRFKVSTVYAEPAEVYASVNPNIPKRNRRAKKKKRPTPPM